MLGGQEGNSTLFNADSAYPMHSWMLKLFIFSASLTAEQNDFNYRLSKACIVVENAFGHLKQDGDV